MIPAEAGRAVLQRYREDSIRWVRHDRLGAGRPSDDAHAEHLRAVLATVDVERIRQRRFTVILDSNHGAGSRLGERLLKALGCEVITLGGQPDGCFEHPPEPIAENLVSLLPRIRDLGADALFCQDPDADRLAVIDAQGRYLGEEYTLAICVEHILQERQGAIVANCSTSRMTQDIAARHGVPFYRSAVGEANVVDCMLAHDAVFGGEGNGGLIDPRVGLVRCFVGMASCWPRWPTRAPISRLADELPATRSKGRGCGGQSPPGSTRWPGNPDAKADWMTACGSTGRPLAPGPRNNTEPIVRRRRSPDPAGNLRRRRDSRPRLTPAVVPLDRLDKIDPSDV